MKKSASDNRENAKKNIIYFFSYGANDMRNWSIDTFLKNSVITMLPQLPYNKRGIRIEADPESKEYHQEKHICCIEHIGV